MQKSHVENKTTYTFFFFLNGRNPKCIVSGKTCVTWIIFYVKFSVWVSISLLVPKFWCDTNLMLKQFYPQEGLSELQRFVSVRAWNAFILFYGLSCSDRKKSLINLSYEFPLSRTLTDSNHTALLKRSSTVSQQQTVLLHPSSLALATTNRIILHCQT